ncbi:D-ribose ABC transporter, ATP-binding protein [Candidatus Vecturithrix granuli]|uniref:D-ribose ABC transporter, ATP-binding protein n=1 Tax=Vecturithrix granuli TaxID=1499967 RepID=A0A081C3P9_VECG1|nr:D-ribose ABC transporter, ATP-binding protein [Candidatus Vecturithrix granuli]
MTDQQASCLLEMRGITKYFPGVKALDNVDIELDRGEILAVIGENGAGKSTLMNILGGIYHPDTGKIFLDEQEVAIDSVHRATQLGIAFVHQELNLSDNLDVAANVFLGREPRQTEFLRLIDRKKIYHETEKILKRIEMDCSPRTLVRDLTIGAQQMVEIAKALSINARILIMDEPTSSLSRNEAEQLFKVMKELRLQGVGIIYISHRLGEVKEVADRVTVLRDGKVSGRLKREEIVYDNMIRLMVGRDIEKFYHHEHEASTTPVFEVRDFLVPGQPNKPINFTIHAGEILVVAGLVGAGRTELAHALFGIDEPLGGAVFLDGKPITIKNPWDAIRAGIGLVPEDRKLHGLIVEMAVELNTTLAGLDRYQTMKMIQFDQVRSITHEMVQKLNIRLRNINQVVESLSGGNQQKVVLAKWLSLHPRVLLMDEPTRGIDVIAKEEIYRLMEQLASQGVAILVISSEMQEVIGIADRIIVMHDGEVSGELQHKEQFTEEAVVSLATGGK